MFPDEWLSDAPAGVDVYFYSRAFSASCFAFRCERYAMKFRFW